MKMLSRQRKSARVTNKGGGLPTNNLCLMEKLNQMGKRKKMLEKILSVEIKQAGEEGNAATEPDILEGRGKVKGLEKPRRAKKIPRASTLNNQEKLAGKQKRRVR